MDRRLLAVGAVVLLATTAGCSLLGGGSTTPTDGAGTPADGATPTPTTAAFEYPDGYAADGVTDGAAATAAHDAAITDLESFTLTYDAAVRTDTENITVDYTQRADLAAERALLNFTVHSDDQFFGSTTQYYTSNRVYVRSTDANNRSTFENGTEAFNASALTASQFIDPLVRNVSYGEATIVTRDGVRLARYESTELEDPAAAFGETTTIENVTSFSATLWVDGDGLIRRIEYTGSVTTGEGTRSVDAVIRVEAIGATSVPEPDWIERA